MPSLPNPTYSLYWQWFEFLRFLSSCLLIPVFCALIIVQLSIPDSMVCKRCVSIMMVPGGLVMRASLDKRLLPFVAGDVFNTTLHILISQVGTITARYVNGSRHFSAWIGEMECWARVGISRFTSRNIFSSAYGRSSQHKRWWWQHFGSTTSLPSRVGRHNSGESEKLRKRFAKHIGAECFSFLFECRHLVILLPIPYARSRRNEGGLSRISWQSLCD